MIKKQSSIFDSPFENPFGDCPFESSRTDNPTNEACTGPLPGNEEDDDPDPDVGLTNAQRMFQERSSPTLNLIDRSWKYALIMKLLQHVRTDTVVELDRMYADDRLTNAQSIEWEQEIRQTSESDRIGIVQFTDECAAEYDMQQGWMDSLDLQREDHEAACTLLGIINPSVPRILGMRLSKKLTFWQPVAIKAICDWAKSPYLRGGIIADVVGLGKTWMVIEFVLHVSYQILVC